MSTKEYSYRKLYNQIEKACSWQAIDLWTPTGTLFSGRWGIDATKIPKSLPKALSKAIVAQFLVSREESDNLNKIIRLTLMKLEEQKHVVFTTATQPYTQLAFYHPQA